jgi:hypothetical protein
MYENIYLIASNIDCVWKKENQFYGRLPGSYSMKGHPNQRK